MEDSRSTARQLDALAANHPHDMVAGVRYRLLPPDYPVATWRELSPSNDLTSQTQTTAATVNYPCQGGHAETDELTVYPKKLQPSSSKPKSRNALETVVRPTQKSW